MTDPFQTFDPQELEAYRVFFPFAYERTASAIMSGQRFVHYTSAENAIKILTNKEVWLRKANVMNDFSEIEHGLACLGNAFRTKKDDLARIFDPIYPGLMGQLIPILDSWVPIFRNNTFILSMSEHYAGEDKFGRLSMWRAYGGNTGIALVLNSGVFFRPSDALGAYTSPVAYLSKEGFLIEFDRLIDSLRSNIGFVTLLGEEKVKTLMFNALRASILCTKHPGFQEEAEWRIVFSPDIVSSTRIMSNIETISGVPQVVSKIKLENIPHEGLVGATIPEILERVIIGPTNFSSTIFEAIYRILLEAGVAEPARVIHASDIPLRR